MNEEEKQIKCTVKIASIRHYKNNWGILIVSLLDSINGDVATDKYNCFAVKGVMAEPNYQDTYTVVAKEVIDPKWGKQYNLIYMGVLSDMSTGDNQKTFLSKILTPTQIDNLYKTLENPIAVLENGDTQALTKVKGIGIRTAVALIERYKEHVDYSVAYVELDKYGLTPYAIRKIVDSYPSPEIAIQKIKDNPYILADEVEGIGWKKADSIALTTGMHPHAPQRVKAFITYFLEKNAEEGNSYISPSLLMDGIVESIGEEIDDDHLRKIIQDIKDELWWNEDKTQIGLKKYYDLEYNIASELLRIANGENKFEYDGWKEKIKMLEKGQGWEFTQQQIDGIQTVLENQLVVVTGLGGTGKSSVVGGMLKALSNYSFSQCALSGRAAARMTEVTGEQGKTIHRLLGYKPPSFTFNKNNPLFDDIIIVDEISMIGGFLFYQLLQAIKQGTKVVLIGDIGQLESIGVLNVASDIIGSNVIPVVSLTEIHRQAQKSAIITDSISVRNGVQIFENGYTGNVIHGELKDLELDIYVNKAHTAKKMIEKFKENLPKVDSIFDIQVISPMKRKGDSCTFQLNQALQDIYNPYNPTLQEIELSFSKDMKYKIRVGDKVMNVKNNYKTILKSDKREITEYDWDDEECEEDLVVETPIFNGDMGIVKEISNYDIIIDFNRVGEIIIPKNHWKFIELSYACTCHKYQGSESKIVIIGLDNNSFLMLTKEWVYTAITRAKEYCVLCAESKALRYAISHNSVSNKKSHLKRILKNFDDIVHAQKIKEDRLLF